MAQDIYTSQGFMTPNEVQRNIGRIDSQEDAARAAQFAQGGINQQIAAGAFAGARAMGRGAVQAINPQEDPRVSQARITQDIMGKVDFESVESIYEGARGARDAGIPNLSVWLADKAQSQQESLSRSDSNRMKAEASRLRAETSAQGVRDRRDNRDAKLKLEYDKLDQTIVRDMNALFIANNKDARSKDKNELSEILARSQILNRAGILAVRESELTLTERRDAAKLLQQEGLLQNSSDLVAIKKILADSRILYNAGMLDIKRDSNEDDANRTEILKSTSESKNQRRIDQSANDSGKLAVDVFNSESQNQRRIDQTTNDIRKGELDSRQVDIGESEFTALQAQRAYEYENTLKLKYDEMAQDDAHFNTRQVSKSKMDKALIDKWARESGLISKNKKGKGRPKTTPAATGGDWVTASTVIKNMFFTDEFGNETPLVSPEFKFVISGPPRSTSKYTSAKVDQVYQMWSVVANIAAAARGNGENASSAAQRAGKIMNSVLSLNPEYSQWPMMGEDNRINLDMKIIEGIAAYGLPAGRLPDGKVLFPITEITSDGSELITGYNDQDGKPIPYSAIKANPELSQLGIDAEANWASIEE